MNPEPATIGDLSRVIENIVTAAIYLAASGVVIMLVVGGFQYLMAGGDKEATQRAGKTITFAVAGLLVVVCSWLIIRLLANFLNIDVSNYIFRACLPGFSGRNCLPGLNNSP